MAVRLRPKSRRACLPMPITSETLRMCILNIRRTTLENCPDMAIQHGASGEASADTGIMMALGDHACGKQVHSGYLHNTVVKAESAKSYRPRY